MEVPELDSKGAVTWLNPITTLKKVGFVSSPKNRVMPNPPVLLEVVIPAESNHNTLLVQVTRV